MPYWSIKTRGKAPVTVEAENWILAMGSGVATLDEPSRIERLVCEMLQNGTVLARDVRSGHTFIIRPIDEEGRIFDEEPETIESEEPFVLGPAEETPEIEPPDLMRMESGLRAILNARTVKQAWATGLRVCREQIVCEAGAGLVGAPNEEIFFISTTGRSAHMLLGIRLPANTGFVGLCISQRICLLVNEVDRDPRHYRGIDSLTGLQTRSVLCAPVAAGEKIYGCLEMLNPPGRFNQRDLATIEAIGDAVGARLATLEGVLTP